MFLETNLNRVSVLLLGADLDSRTANRLRAAGAHVLADLGQDTAPGFVVVVGERGVWDTELEKIYDRCGPVPTAFVAAERTGVTLVGGGPGPDDLVTARGLAALADADVVLLDRLAPQSLVESTAPHARVIRVGKWPGHHPVPQEEIQKILVESAAQGQHVVRLKGGDPYVFGRGGEEAADCESWGVPVEVIPGISSAISVPGAAGIPLTFRDVARTFTVASGHAPFSDAELAGFGALLNTGATVVILMGVATLPQVLSGLMQHGVGSSTPIAVVENGFNAGQKTWNSTLGTAVIDLANISSPAVIVIGPVAALASEERERVLGELTPHRAIASQGRCSVTVQARTPLPTNKPLHGYTVAITAYRRAEDQIRALERKGATTLAAPALKLVPVDQDAAVLAETERMIAADPDMIVVTTGYGFKRWWDVLDAAGYTHEAHAMLARADIWVRGPKGRAAVRGLGLADVGISPDETLAPLVGEILEAHDHDLAGVVIGWQENGYDDRHQRARLMDAGATVHTVTPHRWACADDAGLVPHMIRMVCAGAIDAVTFTSAAGSEAVLSTASEMGLREEFVAAFQHTTVGATSQRERSRPVVAATVGPVTAAPLQAAGIAALVPERFRMGAMIQQLAHVMRGLP